MTKTKSTMPVGVIEETPAYWRVLFDYPPFNIMDATIFEGLRDLLARMDSSPSLRVVVFESSNPEFYLAHFDLTGKLGNIMTAVGPSGLPILMDTFVRLTTSPVVSLAKIRGCVRGACSEFVLACDMRFASRENTLLGQPEVGVGVHPGGGGAERLPHLVGRGRALEIILGANDFDGDTAERYGYVNRSLPDAELDGFVDALARRIASFDRQALAAAKNLVNQVSLPPADRLLDAFTSFGAALTWPEAQHRIQAVVERCNGTLTSRKLGPRSSAILLPPKSKGNRMTSKIELERFRLTSSRPFDEVLASIKGAVGHPDMVEFVFFSRKEHRYANDRCLHRRRHIR